MAGHSKWANIKHRKGRADAQRGKIFSKVAKEIMVAARIGGGDPAGNITLRALIQKARGYNMPADNIERAIKKGTGELEGQQLEELTYEGYGAGGVGIIVSCLTDNKNRTAAEVRHAFTRFGGSLGAQGSVSRSFQRRGLILIDAEAVDEEKLMEVALEAGVEDMEQEDGQFQLTTDPNEFMNVVEAIDKAEIPIANSEVTLLPDTYMQVTDSSQAKTAMRLIEALEDLDDVQDVYTNMDVDESVIPND